MSTAFIKNILPPDDCLVVLDGGARGGPKNLRGLETYCQSHCFEPNPEAIAGIKGPAVNCIENKKGNDNINVYPFALSGKTGSATLNISLRPGATSTLEPNKNLLQQFNKDHFSEMQEIVSRIEVPSISLSDFMKKNGISFLDFVKLDTQGNELDILKSAGHYIDSISVIMTEVEMIPLYQEQPLFHDMSHFLYQHGFELIDIAVTPTCRRFHARPDLPPSAYRLVWGEAIYVRNPHDNVKPRFLQQALILAGLGYADMAIDMFDRNPNLNAQEKGELEIFARQAAEPDWLSGRIKRFCERSLGLLIQRYSWKKGQQINSLKSKQTNSFKYNTGSV